MTLSQLCLLLATAMIVSHGLALLKPESVGAWLRAFPRNAALGVPLMLLGTAWFEWNLWHIAPWKNLMLAGFALVGIGSCIWVKDYLSVRGLSVVMLMVAWYVCEKARWHESLWRDALIGWAYVWVFLALWWSMSPWRMRDGIQWCLARPGRLRAAAAAGVAWGCFVAGLGLTVLR
ncbi:MAG: hypothetical protein J0L84_08160 [Verrucomicrobia bacterium]|nr:hypothetical protein [Verrucomicrobiota bacterium]